MNSRVAAAIYVAVTCVVGRNVLASLESAIASDAGDPLLNAAILAWNAAHVPWSEAWFQFPIFHPTRDALTLSEHLLGLSVIAAPLQWAAGNPAAAYNLTLLSTYPLSGLAMYALVWRMTRSAPAAFVAGLAYAFAPYRAGQLPHIQMLAVFWAPLALLGLHGFVSAGWPHAGSAQAGPPAAGPAPETAGPPLAGPEPAGRIVAGGSGHASAADAGAPGRRWPWLALFAVCWALQGAANGYMLVYFSLLVGAWVLWFLVGAGRWRETLWVAGAAVAASLPLLPILARYASAQRDLGLSRNLGEISAYGADIASMLCAPSTLTVWGWLRIACAPEGELFPGLGPVLVLAAGVLLAARAGNGRRREVPSGPPARITAARRHAIRAACVLALVFAAVAISVVALGAWRLEAGPVSASASSADKPLSTALALLLIAFLLSDRLRAAAARRSPFTFYAGAAVACWVLAWGPFPRLFDTPALYQAPYAWLLQLPAIDALRVPARFWMMTVLCLSVCAGLVLARLPRDSRPRTTAAILSVAAGVFLLDGWMAIAAARIPPPPAAAAALRGAPVLVAPAGDLFSDAAAVYHAVAGGWTAINGYSGYEPGYYEALRTLSQAGDERQLTPFLRLGDVHLVDARGVQRLAIRQGPAPPRPAGRRLALSVSDASCERTESAAAVDGDLDTRWLCGTQTADQHVTLDLGQPAAVHAVVHALGSAGAGFPRHLVVQTSLDGEAWQPAWEGSPAPAVLEAALAAPREARIVIPFTARPARYLRLRQTGRHETTYWAIAEIEAWGP